MTEQHIEINVVEPCGHCEKMPDLRTVDEIQDIYEPPYDRDDAGEYFWDCKCGIVSTLFMTVGEALDWWNKRPIEKDLKARIAKLEAKIQSIYNSNKEMNDRRGEYDPYS